MRRIYQYMSDEEKREAMEGFARDLQELKRERENPAYPRVVREAIEETIERYQRDIEYLRDELGDSPET